MREFIRDFCRITEETLDLKPPIVEIGSFQVAGQEGFADLRPLFASKQYIGCDMRAGPGVDRVETLPRLSFSDRSVPTIICLDTLEHVYNIRESMTEFDRILGDEGILVVSSVFNFPIHSHPYDYWRFTPQCFERLLQNFSCRFIAAQGSPAQPHTVYGIGFKGRVLQEMEPWSVRFEQALRDAMKENLQSDVKAYIPRKFARLGLLHGIPRYPFYRWNRLRYERERQRLEASFSGNNDQAQSDGGPDRVMCL